MSLKAFKTICCVVSFLFAMACYGQTQQGIVKTKGRLNGTGKLVAGERLAGATITVKGRTPAVSGANGEFSFPVPGKFFFLQSVSKQGYSISDPDILSKQYSYSKDNPLYVVLEKPDTQLADKLAAERKIRRTLQHLKV